MWEEVNKTLFEQSVKHSEIITKMQREAELSKAQAISRWVPPAPMANADMIAKAGAAVGQLLAPLSKVVTLSKAATVNWGIFSQAVVESKGWMQLLSLQIDQLRISPHSRNPFRESIWSSPSYRRQRS